VNFVIDASVAIKWLVPEEGSVAAVELRKERLAAPDLLSMECANALWKKVGRKEILAEEAALAAGVLEVLDIELVPMRQLVRRSVELAIELNHPAYDCAYLALSAMKGWSFVTADESLLRKVDRSRAKRLGIAVSSLSEAATLVRKS
jgi:predicted nucleic acid-binding protein